MEATEKKFRDDLKDCLDQAKTSEPLSENDKIAIQEAVMDFLGGKAETVEGLFNPDREDYLEAVPLYWTRKED